MSLSGQFCVVLNCVYFVVAIFDLMPLCTIWSLHFTFLNCEQHVEIFSEIRVIPRKVAQLSLILPKGVPDDGIS